MNPRPVKVEPPADDVLLALRLASEYGRLPLGMYRELLDWFDRTCVELATGFDQFGTRVRSLADFFAGRVTRARTDVVAGSRPTLTATLNERTQTVWVISLSSG
jgi:hypothetical protein